MSFEKTAKFADYFIPMKKLLILLYQPYKWLFFYPFLCVNTLIFGTLAIVFSLTLGQKIGSFIGGVLWSRLNGFLTPMFVTTAGKENIDKKQSYVIVANHMSAYDIFLAYGWLGIDFKWVMKKELKKIPGLGFGSEAVGHIFIDRSSSKAALETIEKAKKKIKNGTSVLFFPEGTRSKDGELGRFKKGAFNFAFDLNLPILPVTINGTNKIMPSGSFNLLPGKAKLIVHSPIDISQYTRENVGDLMEATKKVIDSGLENK